MGEPVHRRDPLTSGGPLGPFVLELSEVSISMFVKDIFILDAARRVGHLIYRLLGNLVEHCWLHLSLFLLEDLVVRMEKSKTTVGCVLRRRLAC